METKSLKNLVLGKFGGSWRAAWRQDAQIATRSGLPSEACGNTSWRQDVFPQASEGSPERVAIWASWRQAARQEPPNFPRTKFFKDFVSILLPILSEVVENVLENFCFILALSVPC